MPKRTEEELLARDRAKVKAREDKINARKARSASKDVRSVERDIADMQRICCLHKPTDTIGNVREELESRLRTARILALSGPGGAKQ